MIASTEVSYTTIGRQLFGQSWSSIVVFSAEPCSLFFFFFIFCYAISHVHVLLSTNQPLLHIHERPIVYFPTN